MNYRNQIENTEAFKAMEPFKQSIYKKATNIRSISEHIVIAKNIGFDNWKQEHKPNPVEENIVKEIVQPQN